ncbi:MAG: tRNA (adenosine(37)-N6)-threonylcarbamoyltransferase complex dimerization subunit type 1 TsaB [Planctomycetes bacterium]|nr:tRNA (adenosine(37)-N6)-threonylcarbamoyltransferase complex dimerization subunit type 1 TsaB [Planctomycetota bacterium]
MVRILALETTERIGSVAAMQDGNLLQQLALDGNLRSAQALAPAVRALMTSLDWKATDVQLVAAVRGPGSFTGLRVGITTAKALAYCAGAEVLAVDTLEVIASAAPPHLAKLGVAVDAQRGEVVAGLFQRGPSGHFTAIEGPELIELDRWFDRLDEGTPISGPILHKWADRVPPGLAPLAPQYWSPTAAAVAALAHRLWTDGQRDDLWTLAPRYSRRSAAEEKWEQRPQG